MSIAVDISSVVGCVLSAISLGFPVKVFQKIDSFVKNKKDELSVDLENAKIKNRGYSAGVFIEFDSTKTNWEVYSEAIRSIDLILKGVKEHEKYNKDGNKIVEYGTYNHSLRAKGYIMLLEIQYLETKINADSIVDNDTLKKLNRIKTELTELQEKAIPYE